MFNPKTTHTARKVININSITIKKLSTSDLYFENITEKKERAITKINPRNCQGNKRFDENKRKAEEDPNKKNYRKHWKRDEKKKSQQTVIRKISSIEGESESLLQTKNKTEEKRDRKKKEKKDRLHRRKIIKLCERYYIPLIPRVFTKSVCQDTTKKLENHAI